MIPIPEVREKFRKIQQGAGPLIEKAPSELVCEIRKIREKGEVMRYYRSYLGRTMLAAILSMSFVAGGMAKDYRVILGAGVGAAPDYEGSRHYDVIPLATVSVRWFNGRYLNFEGNSFKANIIASDRWSFGPTARYQFERDDPDSEAVDRLREVNAAFEVGAFAGVSGDHFSGDIEVVKDVAGSHEGFLVKLGGGYGTQVGERLNLSLGISTTYASEGFMEAYFEIDADNAARSGLPLFDAEGGFKDVGISLFLRYSFDDRWGMFGLFNYTRLIGDAEESPIVDDAGDPNQYFGGIGANYSF